jgi:hypothetical protein
MLLPLRASGLPLAVSAAAGCPVGAPADMPSQEPHPVKMLLAESTAAAAPGSGTVPDANCSRPWTDAAQHSTTQQSTISAQRT